jgi:hypothetical protein
MHPAWPRSCGAPAFVSAASCMTTQMHGAGMEPPGGEFSANDDVMGGDQEEGAETSPAASSGMSSESFVEEMLLKPLKHGG